MTAVELAGYSLGGALATGGLWAAAVFGRRALIDAYDRHHAPDPPAHGHAVITVPPVRVLDLTVELVRPAQTSLIPVRDVQRIARLFHPATRPGFSVADFWLTGDWLPDHLEPALICDDVLTGLPWQTLNIRELTR